MFFFEQTKHFIESQFIDLFATTGATNGSSKKIGEAYGWYTVIIRIAESGLFNQTSSDYNTKLFKYWLTKFLPKKYRQEKPEIITVLKAAQLANLHEALFFLSYDNARIHAQNSAIIK